jgi:hypothetical protein
VVVFVTLLCCHVTPRTEGACVTQLCVFNEVVGGKAVFSQTSDSNCNAVVKFRQSLGDWKCHSDRMEVS